MFRVLLTLVVGSILLAGCHEDHKGPLYQYTVTCSGESEPHVFAETIEKSITYNTYTTGYIKLTINNRHDTSTIEEYEWPDPLGCSIHKKFLRNAEPMSNDG